MYRKCWLLVALLFVLMGAGLSYSQSRNLYRDSVDEKIKLDLKKSWARTKKPSYVLDRVDKQFFQNGQEDVRVLYMLKELTRGRKHILGVRAKSGYPNSDSVSREAGPNETSVSAHSEGIAFDIFYADGVEIGWQTSQDAAKRKKAQSKIRQIMKEMLEVGRQNSYYLPTQLIVYRRADILAFGQEARSLYGGYPPDCGLRGMMVFSRCWDRIHVGY